LLFWHPSAERELEPSRWRGHLGRHL